MLGPAQRSARLSTHAGLVGLVAGILASSPSVAIGAPVDEPPASTASEAYAEARRYFEAQEYLAAAEALRRAFELDPNPDYLYQRGHALRLAGSCTGALEAFREVETLVESDVQRSEVGRWIAHCQRVVDELPPPSAQPDPMVAPPDRSVTPTAPAPPPRPRTDVAAGVTLGVGAGLSATGIGLLVGAAVLADRIVDLETEPAYDDRRARVQSLQIAGAVVLGVGAVAMVTASIRYTVLGVRRRRALALRVHAGGLGIRF